MVGTMRTLAFAMAVALGVSACGGGGYSPTAPSNTNVTGTWDGQVTVTGGSQLAAGTRFTVIVTLAQSGNMVSGTFATEGGASGQLSGSVSGQALSFAIAQGPPCAGTFDGSAAVSTANTQMSGAYSGSDCNGTLQANFTASRR